MSDFLITGIKLLSFFVLLWLIGWEDIMVTRISHATMRDVALVGAALVIFNRFVESYSK